MQPAASTDHSAGFHIPGENGDPGLQTREVAVCSAARGTRPPASEACFFKTGFGNPHQHFQGFRFLEFGP